MINILTALVAINSVILIIILKQQKTIMAKVDDIKTLISGINDDTNNIAADLERIAGGVKPGLTEAEADDVISELTAAATKLKAVANTTPEPVEPPTEPV